MTATNPTTQLSLLIRAKYPIIVIESSEESRVMAAIKQVAATQNKGGFTWSISQGITRMAGNVSGDPKPDETTDPIAAFRFMIAYKGDPALFVMKDLHNIINNPQGPGGVGDLVSVRWLRDIAAEFTEKPYTLILVSPAFQLPVDLSKEIAKMDWPLPSAAELELLVVKYAERLKMKRDANGNPIKVDLSGENKDRLVRALQGLTEIETNNVLSLAVMTNKGLDARAVPLILNEKKAIVRKSGTLEYYETDVTQDDIGGLANLKAYTARKRASFSKEAEEFGLPTPKGLFLVGPSGTGKSLTAKAATGGMMPLLRLDIGALLSQFVGQSEGNLRAALRVAEATAPCVLWIDEAEKGFAGTGGSGELDSGVNKRMFGAFLTWMEERKAPVYTVATANDVSAIPPELLQRFDDLFFVDLPNDKERAEIITIQIKRVKRDPKKIKVGKVVDATEGFSGREIQKVIESALSYAFYEDEGDMTTAHLLKAASEIVPTSVTKAEQVKALREWAATRARPANASNENSVTLKGERSLEFD